MLSTEFLIDCDVFVESIARITKKQAKAWTMRTKGKRVGEFPHSFPWCSLPSRCEPMPIRKIARLEKRIGEVLGIASVVMYKPVLSPALSSILREATC